MASIFLKGLRSSTRIQNELRYEFLLVTGLAQNGTEELKKSLEEAEDSRAKAEKLGMN